MKNLLLAVMCGVAGARGLVRVLALLALFSAGSVFAQIKDDVALHRIVVKFKDDLGVSLQGAQLQMAAPPAALAERNLNASGLAADMRSIEKLARDNQLPLRSVFGALNRRAAPPAAATQALPDLSSYFFLPLDTGWNYARAEALAARLRALGLVDEVMIEPVPEVAAIVEAPGAESSDTPDFENRQGYLAAAPNGVDAYHAWDIPGGRGDGVKVADIEFAMDVNHEDLPALFVGVGLDNTSYRDHGTAVMGVVGSVNNGFGTTGIAHNAQLGFVSHQVGGVAEAIYTAADAVGPGGVIIIEVHYSSHVPATCTCNLGQCGYIPSEFFRVNYDAIRYAVALGVTVVQAAGNGSIDLDNPAYVSAYGLEGREDSGAITVGGGMSASRTPMCWSNYGSYVDVHGWGQNVATTGYGDLYNAGTSPEGYSRNYTAYFSGTSSASPVVAGAVASLQGMALAETGSYLNPAELKSILVNTGSPQTETLSRDIGPLPNLQSAANHLLGLPPVTTYENVYFRGTANAWAPLPMTAVYDHTWEVIVQFDNAANPRFKFDMFGDWSENYGDTDRDTIADRSGADIIVQPNTQYKITFHELTRRYSVTPHVTPAPLALKIDWSSSAWEDVDFTEGDNGQWSATFEGTHTWERYNVVIARDGVSTRYWDADNDGVLDVAVFPEDAFEDTVMGFDYTLTVNPETLAYTLTAVERTQWRRTLVFIYGQTQPGQDMFIRGGIDHNYAANVLGRQCTAGNYLCAIPIRHLNYRNGTTAPWKYNDNYLDWYGLEYSQSGGSGSALDWTIDTWPPAWGPVRTYERDGSGETPLNRWGGHYWLFEVEMDCSATVNGWFELKSFISNGPGWEADVRQPGAPWTSGNHFAQCGRLNVFRRGDANPVTIEDL